MALESLDFQPLVHQLVSQLMEGWRASGFSEEEIQETAAQFFNLGIIAAQQVQQEGSIQPQGTNQQIPYTEAMAERVVAIFLQGLNAAVLKAHEQRLPSQEKWAFMQNTAYHVFEHSKQAIIATFGQEHTPDVQISDEQILDWLSQTAVEAMLYYLNEHEKEHGPIHRGEEALAVLPEEQQAAIEAATADLDEPPVAMSPTPTPATAQAASDREHKYAAVALLLSNLSTAKQQKILATFQPDEQEIIQHYRDPDRIAQRLDLGLVAYYLKQFKAKMGQGKTAEKSQYASGLATVIQSLPPQRLERLFQDERPFVRGYIRQFTNPSNRELDPYTLPPGVEESLILYLQRNFPNEVARV